MGGRLTVRHSLMLGCTISAIAIASVVAMGIPVAGAVSPGIVGKGTNDDPYTVSDCPQPSSQRTCTIEFNSISLKGWETKDTLAYVCPKNYPYLLNKNYSPGRSVPGGVQVNEPGGMGVTILSYKLKRGTADIEGKKLAADYVLGILTGKGSATNWDPFSTKSYSITLHCTANSDDAVVRPVRG